MTNQIAHDYPYLALMHELVHKREQGKVSKERTGTGATNLFGRQMRFNLAKGFPLLTTKKTHMHSIIVELLWFLKGDTNIKYLLEHNVHIWTDWRYKAYVKWHEYNYGINALCLTQQEFEQMIINNDSFAQTWGDIGKGYGHQWRNFGEVTAENHFKFQGGFDQISWIINEIKTNPSSRRLIVTGWNPHEIDSVDLPPCHTLFQFFVEDGKLSCQLYQRSADFFLGVPFNIASYALLTHLVARECGLEVGDFVWTGGVVHLYANHIEQAQEQLKRVPFVSPSIEIDEGISIFDLEPHNIRIVDYEHHPAIKGDVAV